MPFAILSMLAVGWYFDELVKSEQRQQRTYLITFNIGKVHGLRNELGHRALAAASWAGDEPNVVMGGLGRAVLGGIAIGERFAVGKRFAVVESFAVGEGLAIDEIRGRW